MDLPRQGKTKLFECEYVRAQIGRNLSFLYQLQLLQEIKMRLTEKPEGTISFDFRVWHDRI